MRGAGSIRTFTQHPGLQQCARGCGITQQGLDSAAGIASGGELGRGIPTSERDPGTPGVVP